VKGVLISMLAGAALAFIATAEFLGWIPNSAGVVFFGLVGTGLILALIHSAIVRVGDTTNGNDIGLVVFFIGIVVVIICLVVFPLIALFFGKPWLAYGIGAGIMALFTIWGTRQMCR
jgi:Na+/phosphate symporter